MEMKIPAIAITAVVVVIVLAGVLMPVLDDATTTEDTFTNDGIIKMKKVTAGDSLLATWDPTDPYNFTVDGDKVALPQESLTFNLSVVGAVNLMVRYIPNDATYGTYLSLFSETSTGAIIASTVNERTFTVSATDGEITISDGSTSATSSFDVAFITANDGDYVMKNPGDDVYLVSDSEIYGFGRSWLSASSSNANFNVFGTPEEMSVTSYGYGAVSEISNITINSTDVNGYKDLIRFRSVSFSAGPEGGAASPVTFSQVIVPVEVSAEKSVHFTDNQNAIFAAIPIMVIVALLIAVVALVFRGRDF